MDAILSTVSSGSTWLVLGTGTVCLIIGALAGAWHRLAGAGPGISAGVGAMLLAGILIAGLLVWGLGNSALLTQLSTVAASRGIVTYLLIITTASVIVISAIGNYWITDNIQDKHRASKDLVALLLTLVGPILGFYFGSSPPAVPPNPSPGASAPAAPGVAGVPVPNAQQASATVTPVPQEAARPRPK